MEKTINVPEYENRLYTFFMSTSKEVITLYVHSNVSIYQNMISKKEAN